MYTFVVRRFILLVPVLIGVSIITFLLSSVLPADPVRMSLGLEANEQQVQELRSRLGFDKPLIVQYGIYLRRLLRGDMGMSFLNGRPVSANLATFFPATLELSLLALVFALVAGAFLGIISAVHRGRLIDHLCQTSSFLGIAVPNYWVGIILIIVFFLKLRWFPSSGRVNSNLIMAHPVPRITGMLSLDALLTGNWIVLRNTLWHATLPALTLSLNTLARITRMMRATMIEVLGEDYIVTARAKGMKPRRVVYLHALRNALIPIVTVAGTSFGYLLAGSVFVETVFSWPGIGKYAYESILFSDFTGIVGVTLLATVAFSLINLLVDILYGIIDPRIRYDTK
jgi:peptide/nickel transport system permease protein